MDATRTMRAVQLDEVGPPSNLKVIEVPVPAVGPNDVLIRTELAGILYSEAEARRGTYFTETKLPWRPGREVGGVVEAVGETVEGIKAGDRVIALVMGGGCYAEYVLASTKPYTFKHGATTPASDIVVLPEGVSVAQALPYLVNFRLAHMILHYYARAPKGARVLVHGASGGMGSTIIQLCHAHGCEIFATVRTEAEAEFCKSIGADHVIQVPREDYVERVKALTDGKGVQFSFNGIGGDTVNTDPDIIEPFGEIHAYGYTAGKKLYDVFKVSKSIALKTFSADDFFPTPAFAAATQAMHDWFKSGPLLEIKQIFSLEDAPEAHRRLDEGEVIGKLGLRP